MERLQQIGRIAPLHASRIKRSRMGIGFEKLDRNVFDPFKAYDKLAATGVKWVRIQSGWARTEKEKGVYDFSWLDSSVDELCARGLTGCAVPGRSGMKGLSGMRCCALNSKVRPRRRNRLENCWPAVRQSSLAVNLIR